MTANYRSNKYYSKKIVHDNEKFDSKKEFNRFKDLQLVERGGVISGLKRQVKFELIPSQKNEFGKVIERPVSYVADFVYYKNGRKIVEDVKGYKTPEYIIKRKLMLYMHGIRIYEI